ncbi:toprim domain-containing protein [Streptomyces sp. NPDC006477]|uniref:toprim domain-containing protein n=1 Tax=Streptomyces sp. NPDC006477 TaxID=3364747 RepID=UPI0036C98956
MEKYEAVAEKWLSPVLRGSSEWMCACPFCGGNQSLQFNVRSGLWLCFKCEERGSAKRLVEKRGGSYSNPMLGLDMVQESLDKLRDKVRAQRRNQREEFLPETYLARFDGKVNPYWTNGRKFARGTIKEWELGYDPIGPRLYNADTGQWERVGQSVTLPYRTPEGDLLGVFHRRLGDGFPRYIYPKGFDRKGSLFGSWMLSEEGGHIRRAVLVEGSTDAIRVHQTGFDALGQYGSSLHPRQVQLLRRLGVNEIVLFYDYDASGRKATKQALTVLDGFIVRSVQWDTERFCWQGKLCNCGMGHPPLEIGKCLKKKRCRCGREHDVDPGDWKRLSDSTVVKMVEEAPMMGRPEWESRSASRSSRRRSSSRRRGSALHLEDARIRRSRD